MNKVGPDLKLAHLFLAKSRLRKKRSDYVLKAIQIQTYVGCNYSCPFCPLGKQRVQLFNGAQNGYKMEFFIIKSLAQQLGRLKFKGRISPDMGEPLLDDRLPDILSCIKEECPDSFIFIQTNGLLLTEKLTLALIKSGADEIYVNDYTQDGSVYSRVSSFLSRRSRKHITIERRSLRERLSNLAGNIYPALEKPLNISCIRPFQDMFIAYNGKAILCCQDWRYSEIMGDVCKEGLLDIWNNKYYDQIRRNLLVSGRKNNALCSKCDFSGLW
ncbi:MAG: radical SAM/SPASM domain-containing protein [Candidatus Omnitrophota bacterium]